METQAKTFKDLRLKKADRMARVYWTHENILTQLAALSLFVCLILCQGQRSSSFSNAS
jgi:hypothetical protein